MSRLRVLIVDDSLTVRKRIAEVLGQRPDFEVVGEAEDGKRGIELCQSLKPDVVTLDMVMPVMSGLAATEYIMAYCPTPILVVSSSTNRGELFKTYEALAAGAVDVFDKSEELAVEGDWEERLVAAIRMVARIKVITHPRARLGRMGRAENWGALPQSTAQSSLPASALRVLAIGASTGGPGAVMEILKDLPPNFPLPILLVIHLGKTFGSAFAEWLDGESPLRVSFARHGELLPQPGQGRVFMAPPDLHMVLRDGRLLLENGPERYSCRPSVDTLFESVAIDQGRAAAACLLTGMGKDGAQGLLALKKVGAVTVAQDEASSVVYGMPREAALLGAAARILPLERIGPYLVSLAKGEAA